MFNSFPNLLRRIFTTGATVCVTLACFTTAHAKDINDIKYTAADRDIKYPESFESDTKKMMENWYLKNYVDLDQKSDSRQIITATDEEYIERLGKIPTTIELPFNSIVRSYIEMYTGRKRQLVEKMLGLSTYYMPIFEQAIDRHGLPMELKYLPVIESALDPNAVSRAGATGLWQFMLPTSNGLGLEKSTLIDQRCDPYLASDAAARYLKELYQTYGDWSLAIAAYNCGPGNVNKALRRAGGGKKDFWEIYPYLPKETRGYVPAFIAATYVMNYYDKHNISPALARKPLITDTINVNQRVHFEQISEVLDIPIDEIRVLNPQFRKDIIPGDIKPYSLVLPSMQVYAFIANQDTIVNHNAAKYARRDVVEPSTGAQVNADSRGRYVEETTVKTHTVKRGETLASIARKYGVTASSIRQTNRIGRKVKRGQKLKINIVTRRYIPEEAPADSTMTIHPDSIAVRPDLTEKSGPVTEQKPDTTATEDNKQAQASRQPATGATRHAVTSKETTLDKPETKAPAKTSTKAKEKPAKKAAPKKHKVKSGETLSSIAHKYGVTVNQLKQANGKRNDNINIGDNLVIPEKSAKSSKKSKSRSRRR